MHSAKIYLIYLISGYYPWYDFICNTVFYHWIIPYKLYPTRIPINYSVRIRFCTYPKTVIHWEIFQNIFFLPHDATPEWFVPFFLQVLSDYFCHIVLSFLKTFSKVFSRWCPTNPMIYHWDVIFLQWGFRDIIVNICTIIFRWHIDISFNLNK